MIGTVQAFALAGGFLFVALYHGFLEGVNSPAVRHLPGHHSAARCSPCSSSRSASLDGAGDRRPAPAVRLGRSRAWRPRSGVPVRLLGGAFLVLLGLAAAATTQVTGALLVFALLVMPAATAQRLTARPAREPRSHRWPSRSGVIWVGARRRLLLALPAGLLGHEPRLRALRAGRARGRRAASRRTARGARSTPWTRPA